MKTYRRLLVLLFATTLAFSPITRAADALPVNINTATAPQIAEALDGVGEIRAAAIVLLRDQMGGFTSVDQLLNVSGIGAATLERIRPLIVLE
ncbi:MAG: helix-hairpin-helix domain-containing protein [Oceanospirillaceae bacterium]|jgi:competence protein ComEA|nr:helix-hairpin-helix domain-containing protein [Oceanospirillaceae bacterium]MBT4443484.1 helix-hairpin-helix domain-containing protein [Oceanospirillaceae bacterium]MBT6076619.1 helix-hairpin-helix domain-containing protein [Oceanospirillaceae bacterium]